MGPEGLHVHGREKAAPAAGGERHALESFIQLGPHERLNLRRDASLDEIKSAYKRLVVELHSDLSHDPVAEEKLKYVNEAYGFLSGKDEIQRRENPRHSRAPYSWEKHSTDNDSEEAEEFDFHKVLREGVEKARRGAWPFRLFVHELEGRIPGIEALVLEPEVQAAIIEQAAEKAAEGPREYKQCVSEWEIHTIIDRYTIDSDPAVHAAISAQLLSSVDDDGFTFARNAEQWRKCNRAIDISGLVNQPKIVEAIRRVLAKAVWTPRSYNQTVQNFLKAGVTLSTIGN